MSGGRSEGKAWPKPLLGFPPGWLTGQGKLFRMGQFESNSIIDAGSCPRSVTIALALGDSEQGNPYFVTES